MALSTGNASGAHTRAHTRTHAHTRTSIACMPKEPRKRLQAGKPKEPYATHRQRRPTIVTRASASVYDVLEETLQADTRVQQAMELFDASMAVPLRHAVYR